MTEVTAGIDTHQIALINPDGTPIKCRSFPTDLAGLHATRDWLLTHNPHPAGIKGTSSYGAALATVPQTAGIKVVEVTRPNRAPRRRQGKTDTIDAYQAAEAARTQQRTSPVKYQQRLATLRAHYNAHKSAVTSRTQAGNQLRHAQTALHPGKKPGTLTLTKTRQLTNDPHPAIQLLASRWITLYQEAQTHLKAITTWLKQHHQPLLNQTRVGPISATELVLAAGENPDRIHREPSFAAAIGVAPIPASSSKTSRHRLNRGGDRRANRAIQRIAFTRARYDERTKTYIARKDPHHKTPKATHRCLTRYIYRELFPILKAAITT